MLNDILAIFGAFMMTVLLIDVLIIIIMKIRDSIVDCLDTKRYECEIAHRFDDPPLAKCHCIDCQYRYGEPTKTGSGVYCSLFGGGIVIQDNSFCYRAQPKKKEDVRND